MPTMTTNTPFLSWYDTPSRDLSNEVSSLNLADIGLPRNPRTVLPKAGWLFVYPCGTPIDFCISDEVSPTRRKYWTLFIEVRIYLTYSLYAKNGYLTEIGRARCACRLSPGHLLRCCA
jgi:hypothetical protein